MRLQVDDEKLLMIAMTKQQSRLNTEQFGSSSRRAKENLSCRAEEAAAKKKLPRHNTRPRRQQKPLQA